MPQAIEFFFDFSSPYGYIASRLIDDLAARHGREVIWKPILLGAIFKLTGMAPLTTIPLKGNYVQRDFPRTARFHGIPFAMPTPFPFSGVQANRAFYWLDSTDPAAAHGLAHALYDAAFSGHDISRAEAVVEIAAIRGIDRAAVSAGMASPEAKDRTRTENDAAAARNVFGSPYIIVDGEPFWGSDRLDHIEKWLETGGW
ncbi:MAG: 2-hydroxychromene-2-carboxylate isomerase [Rhodospirillales bacterium]|nr:2-hydroxychromene-2-carboxylate isomerase [Rhodospirillales bacterium]